MTCTAHIKYARKSFRFTWFRVQIFVLLLATPALSQTVGEYQVKAAFLYNFTKFLIWPDTAFSENEPFVVGVVGKDPFGKYLPEIIAGETVNGRKIKLAHYSKVSDIGKCHILFINNPVKIADAISAVQGRGVLTVSDDPNFCSEGGIIRFYQENGMIRLEINTTAAKAANLEINSKLLRISRIHQ